MMYHTTANFYPAHTPKNGYIGRADITVADAIKMRGIAVFQKEDGSLNLRFPTFGNKENTMIYPASKQAYADMLQVVTDAVNDPQYHFGHANGRYNPKLEVSGRLVDEPYADARFTIDVENFCTLRGVATRVADLKQTDGTFVAVDMPVLHKYENKEGETVYPTAFEGLKWHYKDKNQNEHTKDFGLLIRNLVKNERTKLMDRKPELGQTMTGASERSGQGAAKAAQERVPEPVR